MQRYNIIINVNYIRATRVCMPKADGILLINQNIKTNES